MKIRLLLAALVLVGASACHSATEPEPSALPGGPRQSETGTGAPPLPADSTRLNGGYGMGSGN